MEKAAIREAIKKATSRAQEYARDPEKLRKLVEEAKRKSKEQEGRSGPLAEVWKYLMALLRLLQATVRREHTDVPWDTLVLATIAVIYFVVPTDLIPDFLPLGYLDDAAIIAYVITQIKEDLDEFLAWEAEQQTEE